MNKKRNISSISVIFFFFFFSVIILSTSLITTSPSSSPFLLSPIHFLAYGAYSIAPPSPNGPTINDANLTVEKVTTTHLANPTAMAFIGNNDILVLEKNTGNIIRIVDGQVQKKPVLQVPVATAVERGLLGIAVSSPKNNEDGKTYVFLFYTESGGGKSGDDVRNGIQPLGNRLYRYEYVDGQLINPQLLLDLTAIPANGKPEDIGGKVVIGPDNNTYVQVGEDGGHRTLAQNNVTGPPANGLSGILRITQNGDVVPAKPIFGDKLPLSVYYAIGVRNGFGMDFDPITGNLWDTENGPDRGDKIDLVKPGFNSGWPLIQGYTHNNLLHNGASPRDLVHIGKSKYSDPKFVWDTTIGITALKFLNSDKLGEKYKDNIFVGDVNNGYLYRFTLNDKRDDIKFDNTYGPTINVIKGNEIRKPSESLPIVFGQGFGGITDIQVGPDGYLYVLSYTGGLYRILPTADESHQSHNTAQVQKSSINNSAVTTTTNTTNTNTTNTTNNNQNSVSVAIIGIKGSKSYSPNPLKVKVGQTVTWYNGDAISHTVTSGSLSDPNKGKLFDSRAIVANQHYSLIFDDPGIYHYYCIYHPSMIGTIIVK